MAQQVRGVIAPGRGEPVRIATITIPDPGPAEVVVQVQACGVCHTDLHYREGGINDEFPFLLGHEAAGVVESVGDGVTDHLRIRDAHQPSSNPRSQSMAVDSEARKPSRARRE